MWKSDISTALVVLGLLGAAPAAAQDGAEVLERIDSTLNAFRDMAAIQRMTLIDPDGREKIRVLDVYQKGPDRRLVKFQTPADVRDVGFLRLAEDQMYLYLPAFRRVRRIASSIKNEAFMGTDLSYEDLSRTRYGDDYRVVEASRDGERHLLTLAPRPGADVSYGKIEMEAQHETWVITQMALYDHDGRLTKTVAASDVALVDRYWIARHIEVQTVKDGHRTVLELQDLEFDRGLADDFFSQRQLKRSG